MATLVFGTLGTLVGGPVGGALGTLLGRAVDHQVIGSSHRDGPRLTELAVTGSTYGQPIARHFGQIRSGGTIIWATDLKETSEAAGGGKGRLSTTSYSYSVSLAVALSSRPIDSVGRIWADGNLLRGVVGDLKTGGQMRVHTGHGDQQPDPLMAAALGSTCPAHRGLAYVVFEDLQLADFGNRIPALSFEIFAPAANGLVADMVEDVRGCQTGAMAGDHDYLGFSQTGGSFASILGLLAHATPIALDAASLPLALASPREGDPDACPEVANAIAWADGSFGPMTGLRTRRGAAAPRVDAVRYYDVDRDYQPGLQRRSGRSANGDGATLELPATLSASIAGGIVNRMALRHAVAGERLSYRLAEIDPAHVPGAMVRVPGHGGVWQIDSWEWREGGVELELVRQAAIDMPDMIRDPGKGFAPRDRLAQPTLLDCFELPWDGTGSSDAEPVYVAVSAADGRWDGAALYVERDGSLDRLPQTATARAVTGALAETLGPSPALVFEPLAAMIVELDSSNVALAPAAPEALARGANRLLVGGEVVQFATAQPLGDRRWRLAGLIRGRGGSEAEAQAGHVAGSRVILLEDRLVALDGSQFDPVIARVGAIGSGDEQPVLTSIAQAGRARRPLCPVHPKAARSADGAWDLVWTRRARGAWSWRDGVDVPLVEQAELYEVGVGDPDDPLFAWTCSEPRFRIEAEQSASLAAQAPDAQIWVRQVGSYSKSPCLLLAPIAS